MVILISVSPNVTFNFCIVAEKGRSNDRIGVTKIISYLWYALIAKAYSK